MVFQLNVKLSNKDNIPARDQLTYLSYCLLFKRVSKYGLSKQVWTCFYDTFHLFYNTRTTNNAIASFEASILTSMVVALKAFFLTF